MTKGADLRAAREQAGISLARMAQQTHFTKSYLSLVETGKRPAGPDLVVLYGQVLGSVGAWATCSLVGGRDRAGRGEGRRCFARRR